MMTVAQRLMTVIIILHYNLAVTKKNLKFLHSSYKSKKNETNNHIFQLPQNRTTTASNVHDSLLLMTVSDTRDSPKQEEFQIRITRFPGLSNHRNSSRLLDFLKIRKVVNREQTFKIQNSLQSKTIKPKSHEFVNVETTFLRPKILNALHKTLLVHPFQTWHLKQKFNSTKDIRVHEDILNDVIVNPRNERLKHKLDKVLQGEDVYLDVFGGSNTAGAGLIKDVVDIKGRYTKVITNWWGKTITPITGSHLKLREIAIGGTSSEFFQFCFSSYIQATLDLVFIEMSVNDDRVLPKNANKSLPLEQLTRQLLAYATEPALVYINLFTGLFRDGKCTNLEDYGQSILTDTYNITSLKWRDAVCSKKARDNLKDIYDLFCSDGMHINQLGHAHISLMIINLLRRILLERISSVITNSRVSHDEKPIHVYRELKHTSVLRENRSKNFPRRMELMARQTFLRGTLHQKISLPRPVFINKTSKLISKPLCWTHMLPNYHRVNDVKRNLDVNITRSRGFFLESTRIGGKCNKIHTRFCRVDAYISWTGKTVGAIIALSFVIPKGNNIQSFNTRSTEGNKTRSVAVGIRTCWNCGAAEMWLDSDRKNKKFLNTQSKYGQTRVRIVALHVEPGRHAVNVEIVRAGMVSIIAIMLGPSDGPY